MPNFILFIQNIDTDGFFKEMRALILSVLLMTDMGQIPNSLQLQTVSYFSEKALATVNYSQSQ